MNSEKTSGYININSASIYYEFINFHLLHNNKPVLVFLHEGLGSCAQWKDFPYILSEELNMPVFMYDRFGYGKSEKISESRKLSYLEEEALDWLPKIFDSLDLNKYKKVLIGHSDGGSIALIYPSVFPDNVVGIITEAAHVYNEEKAYDSLLSIVDNFNQNDLKQKLKKYHGNNTETMFYSWAEMWLSDNFRQWNIEHYLTSIKCPVLAIQGQDDEFATFNQLDSIKKGLNSHCELVFIENCKHIPHQQSRDIVKKEMINFIIGL